MTNQELQNHFKQTDAGKIDKSFVAKGVGHGMTNEVASGVCQLASRVAKIATSAEWNSFLQTGKTPPMKLNTNELALLKGGCQLIENLKKIFGLG